jgi:hypothetical protein
LAGPFFSSGGAGSVFPIAVFVAFGTPTTFLVAVLLGAVVLGAVVLGVVVVLAAVFLGLATAGAFFAVVPLAVPLAGAGAPVFGIDV